MTTRGSLARGQGQQQFQGNVQKWVRQWVEPGTGPGSSKVALLKWVPTGLHALLYSISDDLSLIRLLPAICLLMQMPETIVVVPTTSGDRSGSKPGPRFPHLHPVRPHLLKHFFLLYRAVNLCAIQKCAVHAQDVPCLCLIITSHRSAVQTSKFRMETRTKGRHQFPGSMRQCRPRCIEPFWSRCGNPCQM